ncbi:MAG TPA: serine hydrolase [Croceibacterium sp.]|nr:serine hydrolase [Croceibacterium sp.]
MPRRAFPSLAALLLPAFLLAGCGGTAPKEPPLSPAALKAVSKNPGVPREKLARAVDALFTGEGIGETRAVLVLHDGAIAAERYGKGYSARTKFLGWSMSKTVTGVLIGVLVSEGRLRLDDSPPIPAWQRSGDPRGDITLRQLLQMRSGLRHKESSEPIYDSGEVRMLFRDGRDDMAAWAEAQPMEHEAGKVFTYSTPTGVILADIAARILAPGAKPDARRQAVADFFESRVAGPLGAPSFTPEFDAAGTLIGGSMIWATARDWGKFGEMLRHKGAVNGAQLVPKAWVEFMTTPSPHAPDYGAMTWLNRPSGGKRDELFASQGPKDAFALNGHLGQYVIVSPSQDLTIVRLGKTDDKDRPALMRALAKVAALYPSR